MPKISTVDFWSGQKFTVSTFGKAKRLHCRILEGPKVYTVEIGMQKVNTVDFWRAKNSTLSILGGAKKSALSSFGC